MCSVVIKYLATLVAICGGAILLPLYGQSLRERALKSHAAFRQEAQEQHANFRKEANRKYMEFMRQKWLSVGMNPPVHVPKVPPIPIFEIDDTVPELEPVEMDYVEIVTLPKPQPRPQPIEPIPEVVDPQVSSMDFSFYGTACKVRVPKKNKITMWMVEENHITDVWNDFCEDEYNNLLRDCMQLRERLQLSDWAYLNMLGTLSKEYLGDGNEAMVLWAYLMTQTGYKVRMAYMSDRMYLLVASVDRLSTLTSYTVKGETFYLVDNGEESAPSYLNIMPHPFDGEKKLDMKIYALHQFAWKPSEKRRMTSTLDPEVCVDLSVNQNLVDFYNDYPRPYTIPDPDGVSCWKFYANAPFSEEVKAELYPVLRKAIAGKGQIEAANIIIHFMQTTLIYGYDDEVWGYDRPFFAEETLFYPYCDCEDRAILFSRLIRDLLHLDVVLLYLPGHLAAATAFTEPLDGAYYVIDGRKYYYCEPTVTPYADVGWIPQDYKNVKATIIKLN